MLRKTNHNNNNNNKIYLLSVTSFQCFVLLAPAVKEILLDKFHIGFAVLEGGREEGIIPGTATTLQINYNISNLKRTNSRGLSNMLILIHFVPVSKSRIFIFS